MRRAIATLAIAAAAGGCLMPRYLAQAAYGHLDLMASARPIDEVIADPDMPLTVRELLAQLPVIKDYARGAGLSVTRNYNHYVDLDRDYAVYFVGASKRLKFASPKWCFPIAGCFTGLGWFDENDAIVFRDQLEADGWDAMARPAGAYSTGGWFPDPLLSSMLPDGDPRTADEQTGFADLANVVIHESVHATIFVPDEPYFNEGIAEYLGDQLADALMVEHFGVDSAEVAVYRKAQAWRAVYTARQLTAYQQLKALYDSDVPDTKKLEQKAVLIESLVRDLGLRRRPNNATLIEVRVYTASYAGFAEVHAACGSLAAMIVAGKKLGRGDFTGDLQEDLTSVLAKMKTSCGSSAEKLAPR